MASTRIIKISAILDLEQAYDSVPRKNLMARTAKKLSSEIVDMTSLVLQPLKMKSKEGGTIATEEIAKWISEGFALSPTMFNVHRLSH